MLELLETVYALLPLEITVLVSVALWKSGALERSAKSLNMLLQAIVGADKARKTYQHKLDVTKKEVEVNKVKAESVNLHAAVEMLNSEHTKRLLSIIESDIKFLQQELNYQNNHLRKLLLQKLVDQTVNKKDEGKKWT